MVINHLLNGMILQVGYHGTLFCIAFLFQTKISRFTICPWFCSWFHTVDGKIPRHHLRWHKRSWYWCKTNIWGILSGAGFFHQQYERFLIKCSLGKTFGPIFMKVESRSLSKIDDFPLLFLQGLGMPEGRNINSMAIQPTKTYCKHFKQMLFLSYNFAKIHYGNHILVGG